MSGPTAGLCVAAHSQLLVIDIQERLAAAMPEAMMRRTIGNTGILLDVAGRLNIPVTVTEQYPQGLGPTEGAIRAHLPAGSRPLSKTCFSSCGADGFEDSLDRDKRPQVIIAGMETHVCVTQTSIELMERGYQVFVVEDAICARFKAAHRTALARLAHAGIVITCMESVIFEWLRDSRHAAFKAMVEILKGRTE